VVVPRTHVTLYGRRRRLALLPHLTTAPSRWQCCWDPVPRETRRRSAGCRCDRVGLATTQTESCGVRAAAHCGDVAGDPAGPRRGGGAPDLGAVRRRARRPPEEAGCRGRAVGRLAVRATGGNLAAALARGRGRHCR